MDSSRTIHRQLIDEDKNFHRDAIETIAKALGSVDRHYYTIAIIGVQNSGKSTLLNHLFGTNFQVLKQMAGSRTTRGILGSVDKAQPLLILDVEGNDAMDRAQQQDYEKMVATYALVSANVLIINIWSKSLGQYTGSQYETLKVIMDICMDQFKQESPKTILYCVRDFNQEYDDEGQIRRKIVRDVNEIWRKLQKPEQIRVYDNKPEKFFTIQVFVVSRYRQGKTGKFNDDVTKLRQKFVNSKTEGYIFAKQKTDFNLPIEDLPQLSENAWTSIKSNHKLNLPSEKDQLANFRCSTIMSDIESNFEIEMKTLEEQHLVTDYGEIKQKYLSEFDAKTYHYGKKIVDEKRSELQIGIDDHLKKTVHQKVQIELNELVQSYEEEAKNQAKEQSIPLDEQLKKLINEKIQELVVFMKKLGYQVPNRKERIEELSSKLYGKFQDIKSTIVLLAKEEFEKQSSRTVRLLSSEVLKDHFGLNFWEEATRTFQEKISGIIDRFRLKYSWAAGEELNPVEYDLIQEKVNSQFTESIKTELQKTLNTRMLDYFNKLFKHDQDGDMINFNLKTQEQIGEHFDQTRDKVISLIKRLNEFNRSSTRRSTFIEGMDDDQSFFESTWLSNTTQQIDKSMRNEYEKTIRRKKQGQMNAVPWWLYGFILFFVYDDLWFSAQENPIIHYILVALLIIPAFLIAIGQGRLVQESINILMDKLKDRFAFLR